MVGSQITYYIGLFIEYVAIPQHGPLTLSLRAHQLQNWNYISHGTTFG